jgi:hypothetical protein
MIQTQEETMDQVIIPGILVLSFLANFSVNVLAVLLALWIWDRWHARTALTERTPG